MPSDRPHHSSAPGAQPGKPSNVPVRTREQNRAKEEEACIKDDEFEKLRREVEGLKATNDAPRQSTAGLFKAVCSTDLLFLIDTTSSMSSYIEAAKQQVRSTINDIKVAFFNEAEIRMAVVGYKDHGDSPNI